jgi:hypothetical protein
MKLPFEGTGRCFVPEYLAQNLFEIFNLSFILIGFGWQLYPIVLKLGLSEDKFGLSINAPTLRISHYGMYYFLI